eukprot:9093449-Pyramimonas_sp.AAC.2
MADLGQLPESAGCQRLGLTLPAVHFESGHTCWMYARYNYDTPHAPSDPPQVQEAVWQRDP